MKKQKSLVKNFLILFLGGVIVPGIIFGWICSEYFKGKLLEQVNENNQKLAILLVTNIDNYIEELEQITLTPYLNVKVLKYFRDIRKHEKDLDKYNLLNQLSLEIPKAFIGIDDDIEGIGFALSESLYISMKRDTDVVIQQMSDSEYKMWYERIINNDQHIYYYGIHDTKYLHNDEDDITVARIIKDYHSNDRLGIMIANVNTEHIEKTISKIGIAEDTIVQITSNNRTIFSTQTQQGNKVIDEEKYIDSTYTCSNGWEVHILSSIAKINRQVNDIMKIYVYLYIAFIVIMCIIYFGIVRVIIIPFKTLISQIDNLGENNFQDIDVETNIIEVNILQNKLNDMQYKIKQHLKREYKYKIAEKNAQFQALQAQINPHFLYNTFNGFLTLNRLGQRKRLNNSMMALIKIMRYIFKSDNISTIKDEVQLIHQYLTLSKMRFDERLMFDIYVGVGLDNAIIPKLVLQPIVENAIVHGLEPSSKTCAIYMQIEKIINPFMTGLDYVCISIEDTGVGFDMEHGPIPEGEGIHNIKERLEFVFDEVIFHMESTCDKGTGVFLIIPYKEGEHA